LLLMGTEIFLKFFSVWLMDIFLDKAMKVLIVGRFCFFSSLKPDRETSL